MALNTVQSNEISASWISASGEWDQAAILKWTRFSATLETYSPSTTLHTSEVLSEFQVHAGRKIAYCGRAVTRTVVQTKYSQVVEVSLEDAWADLETTFPSLDADKLDLGARDFVGHFHQTFKVLPEVKLVTADLQMFLFDLRQWLDHLQQGLEQVEVATRQERERELLERAYALGKPVLAALFQQFESACEGIDPELKPAHQVFVKRQLHPYVLCSPFMYRTFQKPLGYAGDFEMVRMMTGSRFEGRSLFAKILNAFFLETPPVVAHRNRLQLIVGYLEREAARARQAAGPFKVMSMGCGPVWELEEFARKSDLSCGSELTLVDFNQPTLDYVQRSLNRINEEWGRRLKFQTIKKSVTQVLKESARTKQAGVGFDLIYCAGLFDYLSQPICQSLMTLFFRLLAPGGLLVATNVAGSNPSKNWMEYSVDWHLVYRSAPDMVLLRPSFAHPDAVSVISEACGVNLLIEVRRAKDG